MIILRKNIPVTMQVVLFILYNICFEKSVSVQMTVFSNF
jgi:hypothetical protein